MAVSKKAGPGEGISALIRDAGQRAKLAVEQREVEEAEADAVEVFDANGDLVLDEIRPFKPRIFNVVDYIEQSWGLGMKLFPAKGFWSNSTTTYR